MDTTGSTRGSVDEMTLDERRERMTKRRALFDGYCAKCGYHGTNVRHDPPEYRADDPYHQATDVPFCSFRDGERWQWGTRPWDHAYESAYTDNRCMTCGLVGSYAHTQGYYEGRAEHHDIAIIRGDA